MKILAVDDNEHNLRLLVKLLTRANHEVIQATNGPEAIEQFKAHSPDLILMDIMMPGMDGRECSYRIKQLATDVYIPIIYVSALSQDLALATALEAGGDDFVTKPVNFDILLSKINAHRRIKELNSELIAHNLRLARDQELACHFFDNALKRSFLDPRYIRYHISPAAAFNGDILLAAPRAGGGLYLLLGDFTGHGLAASIGTLPVAQTFYRMAKEGAWIGDTAREINRQLRELLPTDMFLAANLVELNSSGERLHIWAGGLPDACLIDDEVKTQNMITSTHVPLGILDDQAFDSSTQSIQVSVGARLYMYTDGIIEARNSAGEAYGEERLRQAFDRHGGKILEQLTAEIEAFTGQDTQADDISLVELSCLPYTGPGTEEETVNADRTRAALPFSLTLTVCDDQISEPALLSQLSDMICATNARIDKGVLHTILAEMFSNILEHGLLGLDAADKTDAAGFEAYYARRDELLRELRGAEMTIDIGLTPEAERNTLSISMRHNGKTSGKSVQITPTPDPRQLHGRGLLLLNSLCDELDINTQGQSIQAKLRCSG